MNTPSFSYKVLQNSKKKQFTKKMQKIRQRWPKMGFAQKLIKVLS